MTNSFFGSEDHEKDRKRMIQEREISEIKKMGLPYLKPGMSHRAVEVHLKRAIRSAEVRERMFKAEAEEAAQRPEYDPIEKTARDVLIALEAGGEHKQRAEAFLKKAHPSIKEKMLELVGVTSEFKERRSNKPNGF